MKVNLWYINLCIKIIESVKVLGVKHSYVRYLISLKEKYDGNN